MICVCVSRMFVLNFCIEFSADVYMNLLFLYNDCYLKLLSATKYFCLNNKFYLLLLSISLKRIFKFLE